MRGLFILLFLFTATICNAQGVVKERIIARTSYDRNVSLDSTTFSYPSKFKGNTRLESYVQFDVEYPLLNYNVKKYYNGAGEKQYNQIYDWNTDRTELRIYFVDESQNENTLEEVTYLPDTNLTVSRVVYNDMTRNGQYSKYFESYKTYNQDKRVVLDSTVQTFFDTIIVTWVSAIEYISTPNGTTTTITSSYEPALPTLFYITEAKRGLGFQSKETYSIDNGISSARKIQYSGYGKAGRLILSLETEVFNNVIDTIQYKAFEYVDSFDNGNNLLRLITLTKNALHENFKEVNRADNKYDEKNRLIQTETYSLDSLNNWLLMYDRKYFFNAIDQLTMIEIIIPTQNQKEYYAYTYNKNGSITSDVYKRESPNISYSTYTENRYYYEPYLKEEVRINYSQLAPISYPNPFKEKINILFSCLPNKAGQINIINYQGQIIQQHSFRSPTDFYQFEWHSTGFASGIYFAQIIMGKENETIKLMKQ